MRLIVQKYGGTSVGTPERIRNVARRLVETQREGCQVVAVISAVPGETAETIPSAEIVATLALLELHAIGRPLRTSPFAEWSVAEAWVVAPNSNRSQSRKGANREHQPQANS